MDEVRKVLLAAMRGWQAYDKVQQILAEVPVDSRYRCADAMEHSAWQILEHMRITLEDIYDYSTNFDGQYRERDWPADYWPTSLGEGDDWDRSLDGLRQAQARMEDLVAKGDLVKPFAWEPSHCLLREALLAIEHNAYHSGELVELTRMLSAESIR